MDFIRNKTAKLRNFGRNIENSLATRRGINIITLAPQEELAALDPTASSLSPRHISLSPRRISLSPRRISLSPRRVSLSPRTKVITHIQKTFKKRNISQF
jgi:hypothetical protein